MSNKIVRYDIKNSSKPRDNVRSADFRGMEFLVSIGKKC